MRRGQDIPHVKSLRKQGAEVLSEKKYPLPVNVCHPRPLAAEAVCIFSGFKACSLQTGKAVKFGPLPKILSCQLAEFGVNSLF